MPVLFQRDTADIHTDLGQNDHGRPDIFLLRYNSIKKRKRKSSVLPSWHYQDDLGSFRGGFRFVWKRTRSESLSRFSRGRNDVADSGRPQWHGSLGEVEKAGKNSYRP